MARLYRYCLLVVVAIVGMVSHVEAQPWVDKLHVEGVAKVSHISTTGMNLWVTLNNESCYRYEIKSCEVDVYVENRHLATLSLRDKVVIPRKSTNDVLLPLRFRTHSSFVLERLLWRIIKDNGDKITISYRMRAGVRLIKRNFEGENISLKDIFGKTPTAMDMIEGVWNMVQ